MAGTYLDRLEALTTGVARDAGLPCTDTTRDRELSTTLRLLSGCPADADHTTSRSWSTGRRTDCRTR